MECKAVRSYPGAPQRCRNTFGPCDRGHMQRTIGCRSESGFVEKCQFGFVPGIPIQLQDELLAREDPICQMCGVIPGDIDDVTGVKVRFNIEYIVDKSLGGKEDLSNLRTLCSTCNQGAKNITAEKPTVLWLLSQVRRAGQDEQLAVLQWLRKKFQV